RAIPRSRGRATCESLVIASPFLAGRDRYERATDAAVDNTHRDAFTHVVQVSDDDGAAKVRVVCTPSPEYGVREAEAWLTGRGGSCRAIAGFGELAGTRMVSGLTRRLVELTGPGPDAALAVEAGLEVARLARQVARIPAAAVAHLGPEDARQYWQLDTTSWADLPDSCFTYSAAGRAVMETRPVTTSMTPQLYSSPPGTAGVFRRRRLARLVRT